MPRGVLAGHAGTSYVLVMTAAALILEDRGLVAIEGDDARAFLQGLISNDVQRVTPERAIWAALLTPQGKYLHDFFVVEHAGALLLDCEASRRADLIRRLSLFKLRSKVAVVDRTEAFAVLALMGDEAFGHLGLRGEAGASTAYAGGVTFIDPRDPGLGARAILPRDTARQACEDLGFVAGSRADWERLRIHLGLPDGSRDMTVDKAILLENGFDELGGVDWQKGCYMGQELTARTKYRGLVKKRLVPVSVSGPPPDAGAVITLDGRDVGEMKSGVDGLGLALLRWEAIDAGRPLAAGEAALTVTPPAWLRRPG